VSANSGVTVSSTGSRAVPAADSLAVPKWLLDVGLRPSRLHHRLGDFLHVVRLPVVLLEEVEDSLLDGIPLASLLERFEADWHTSRKVQTSTSVWSDRTPHYFSASR